MTQIRLSTTFPVAYWFSLDRQPTIRNKFRTGSVATSQKRTRSFDCGLRSGKKGSPEIRISRAEISLAGRCAPSSDFVLTKCVAFRQSSRSGARSETEPVPKDGQTCLSPCRSDKLALTNLVVEQVFLPVSANSRTGILAGSLDSYFSSDTRY